MKKNLGIKLSVFAAFAAIAEGLRPDAVTHAVLLVCAGYFVGLGLLRKAPPGLTEKD